MLSKQTLIILAVALAGSILGAAVMWYVGPIGNAATGVREVPEHEERPNHAQGDKHGEDGQEQVVHLSESERREFDIKVGTVGPGKLRIYVNLPGEVKLNADRRAHIVPRVSGVVRQVRKSLGDRVRVGEEMAVLDSRELADMKSAYLAAKERVALAEATFRREQELMEKKITSEQEYLQAKQAVAEARIALQAGEQKLHAMGFSDKYIAELPTHPDMTFTRYAIAAPFQGTVIEKHIVLGEVLKDDSTAFVVADLSSVWVDLHVYQKDLPFVHEGQTVSISAGRGIPDAKGKITYLGPLVGEQTRTVLARVVLPNLNGTWRPGLFVTGKVVVENVDVPLLVSKGALQTVEEGPAVFVETAEGLKPRHVTLGRSNDTHVEITSGLKAGERYVTSGAFTLKAQLSKGAFGDGHGH